MVLLAGILRVEIIGTEPRTNAVPVADVIDAWRASEEGPCVRCGARTSIYGPAGTRYAPTAARRELRRYHQAPPGSSAAAPPDPVTMPD
jgi:hypothetical protein